MTERCPTCGSDHPNVKKSLGTHGVDPKNYLSCPDPFHSKPTDEDGLSERPAGTSLGSDRPVSPSPLAESVEGEAGGRELSKRNVRTQLQDGTTVSDCSAWDGPTDEEIEARIPSAYPADQWNRRVAEAEIRAESAEAALAGEYDGPFIYGTEALKAQAAESSLNAALADLAKMDEQWGEAIRDRDAALARAEDWEKSARQAMEFEGMALRRAEEAERERDKLEALAAGQAATIERIREYCQGRIDAQTETTLPLSASPFYILSLLKGV